MTRGEVYRTADPITEPGGKPGFYVIVSRDFIAGIENPARTAARQRHPVRFPDLMFKRRLTRFVCTLSKPKQRDFD